MFLGSYISKTSEKARLLMNGDANDSSGNSNNFTVVGATLTSDKLGRSNRAYNILNSADYLQSPNNTIDFSIPFSFIVDFKWVANQMSAERGMLISNRNGSNSGNEFFVPKASDIFYGWKGGFGTTTNGLLGLSDGWHQAEYQYDGTDFKFYLDGDLQSTITAAAGGGYIYFRLGNATAYATNRQWKNDIGMTRAYQRALRDFEVKNLYLNSQLLGN